MFTKRGYNSIIYFIYKPLLLFEHVKRWFELTLGLFFSNFICQVINTQSVCSEHLVILLIREVRIDYLLLLQLNTHLEGAFDENFA